MASDAGYEDGSLGDEFTTYKANIATGEPLGPCRTYVAKERLDAAEAEVSRLRAAIEAHHAAHYESFYETYMAHCDADGDLWWALAGPSDDDSQAVPDGH